MVPGVWVDDPGWGAESHLSQELDKLARLPQTRPLSQRTPTPTTTAPTPATTATTTAAPAPRFRRPSAGQAHGPDWQRYERVRNNRQRRLRYKRARREGDPSTDLLTCPVCKASEDVTEDIHTHIDQCLRRVEEEGEDEVQVDDVEEYEWCGETRVRATTLLRAEGQLHALGTKVEHGNEDEMVDVCDDSHVYGPSQYTHLDLTHTDANPTHTDTPADDTHMGEEETHTDLQNNGEAAETDSLDRPATPASPKPSTSAAAGGGGVRAGVGGGESAVVAALRERVRELEAQAPRSAPTCRVCHSEYNKPLVSVLCWHVQCEQCWMACLGTKRLCPQCNVITGPSDLRRIYL